MKICDAINKIIERFKQGNLPEALAYACYPKYDVPMNSWSLFNRVMAFVNCTADARGFRQWEHVGRYVKKGAKSFPILAPRFKKEKDEENGEETETLIGFIPVSVFRAEDTDGKPLDYQTLKLPAFPLLEVADAFGVSVKAVPGNESFFGYYSHTREEIALATTDECVFFHELAHAADKRVRSLKPAHGQQLDREIIAELSACTLAYILGRRMPGSIKNHYEYIEQYAKKEKMNVVSACMKYFTCVEAVICEIMKHSSHKEDVSEESMLVNAEEETCKA